MRALTWPAAVAATLLLAACGGGGEDDAKAEYGKSVNTFCSSVQKSVQDVQGDLQSAQSSAGSDVNKAAKAVGGALTKFADGIDDSLNTLKQAEVPEDYKSFHDGATKGLGRVVTVLREAGQKAEEGDVQALSSLGNSLDDIKVPDPPEDLSKAAPECRALSSTSGSGS